MFRLLAATLLTTTLLSGCVTTATKQENIGSKQTADEIRYQRELHITTILDYQTRIDRIANPLLKASLPFCEGQQGIYLGYRVDNLSGWSKEYRDVAKTILKLDEALKVSSVAPDSPAARAGLKSGDIVLQVNGHSTIAGQGAVKDHNDLINNLTIADTRLKIMREGEVSEITMVPEQVCRYGVYILMSNTVNAYADGNNIYLTSGLIRFASGDKEVAMVVGHEIAHNAMEHLEAQKANSGLASIFDIISAAYGVNTQGLFASIGGGAFSKAFEYEADYVGLYIMARAGYEVDGLDQFWRRMAAENPGTNTDSFFNTHPISANRVLGVQAAITEITQKKNAGSELQPTLK